MRAAACEFSASTGTLSALGNGKWQLRNDAGVLGTAIAFHSNNGQNVVIVDLTDNRPPGCGVGMLVASTRQTLDTGATDGTWMGAATTGDWATLTLSGRQIVCQSMTGASCTGTAFTPNVPWQGLMADASGTGFALLAGTGVYIARIRAAMRRSG